MAKPPPRPPRQPTPDHVMCKNCLHWIRKEKGWQYRLARCPKVRQLKWPSQWRLCAKYEEH